MRKSGCAALFAACLIAAPAASAGDFFINGQLGRMEFDDTGFDEDQGDFSQASIGYRWGIGPAHIGLEGGLGKLDDQNDRTRTVFADGVVDRDYTLTSRHGFVGANARIKPPLLPVYFIGRAGYLALERELDETATVQVPNMPAVSSRRTIDETDGGTYYGVGVGTTILPLLDIGLMYNQYRLSQIQRDPITDEYQLSDAKHDARSLSLTVEYRF